MKHRVHHPRYCVFVFGAAAAGPKFLNARVVKSPARTSVQTARAVSGSTAGIFSTPAVPSQPNATWCASAQNGCECVRNE